MSKTHFIFQNVLKTGEALFAVQVCIQRCRDVNRDFYVCFIDYRKALDSVHQDNLMHILRNIGLYGKILKII